MIPNHLSPEKVKLLVNILRAKLNDGLPGTDAHLRLAPALRKKDLLPGSLPNSARDSAVLIVLYPFKKRLHTVVILRNEYDGAHSGQISLPGGKAEESDSTFLHTALREAQEEIGINPEDMDVIGSLSTFYVGPSNFVIYPYLAFSAQRPVFRPDPAEVQKIIEIDVFGELRFEKIVHKELTFKNGFQITAPGFALGREFMWGATAMIISELITLLGEAEAEMGKSVIRDP